LNLSVRKPPAFPLGVIKNLSLRIDPIFQGASALATSLEVELIDPLHDPLLQVIG
jgi:hypothetical protein